MPRIQGLSEVFVSGDGLIKTGEGEIHAVDLSWSGSAAGGTVTFRDGLDASSPVLLQIVLDSAAGSMAPRWPQGKRFTTGLYVDFGAGGQVQMGLTYK